MPTKVTPLGGLISSILASASCLEMTWMSASAAAASAEDATTASASKLRLRVVLALVMLVCMVSAEEVVVGGRGGWRRCPHLLLTLDEERGKCGNEVKREVSLGSGGRVPSGCLCRTVDGGDHE